jgi:DNA topoisomerase-1
MLAFGEALPKIRETVEADLSLPSLPRRKVIATVVRLLETTLIRVGNEEYARANNSFGLTTLRNKHVDITGSAMRFTFVGKSDKAHDVGMRDRRLARIIQQCQDLPGYRLFQYVDEAGERQAVDSADVNEYLEEITGADFTAKDFRTWAGTILAATELRQLPYASEFEAKRNVTQAVSSVAARLRNTPAICRSCYVHPAVIERYLDGTLGHRLRQGASKRGCSSLPPGEAAVVRMLRAEAV